MDIARLMRHLLWTPARLRRSFAPATRQAIAETIRLAEQSHDGQIRFAVEGALSPLQLLRGLAPRERAIDVFSRLRVWDTQHNNGVLIYVLLADHAVEIVADRGINARVEDADWAAICQRAVAAFGRGEHAAGAVAAIEAVSSTLARHFPRSAQAGNELSDEAELLD